MQYVHKRPIWDCLIADFGSVLKDTEDSATVSTTKAVGKVVFSTLMATVNSRLHVKTHSFYMPQHVGHHLKDVLLQDMV